MSAILFQTFGRQVDPAFAVIQYDGIRRDHVFLPVQFAVYILSDLNVQGEWILFPDISNKGLQPSGIRYRLIEKNMNAISFAVPGAERNFTRPNAPATAIPAPMLLPTTNITTAACSLRLVFQE